MPFKGFGEVDTRKLEVTRRLISDLAQHKAKLDLDLLARQEDLMERREIGSTLQAYGVDIERAKTNQEIADVAGRYVSALSGRVGSPRHKAAVESIQDVAKLKQQKVDTSTDKFEHATRQAAAIWPSLPPQEQAKYGNNMYVFADKLLRDYEAFTKQKQTTEKIVPDPKTGQMYMKDPTSGAWMKHAQTEIGGVPQGRPGWVEAIGLNRLETLERTAAQRAKAAKDSKGFRYSYPFMDEAGKDEMQTLSGRDPQDVYNQLKVARNTISLIYDIPSLNADQRGWLSTLFGADRNVTWEQAKQRPDVWDQLSDAQKAPFLKVLMLNAQIKHFEDSYLKGVEPETETTKTTTTPSTPTEGKIIGLRKTAPSGG